MFDFSPRFRFSDWPNRTIPSVAAGVYVIWHGGDLIYCGMSGRGIERALETDRISYGLFTRLNSHASGRLSGDQFCVYVANRIIIPSLTQDDLVLFKTATLSLDQLTKRYIRENYEYQYRIFYSSREAFEFERDCRAGEVFGKKPVLNPR